MFQITPREADYIAAIAAFYRDNDKLDHQTRAVAYEKAMEHVYERYPDDREAAVFYALALNASALKTDKTFANQRKAAEILNKIWKEEPNHPGVVHYLIHSDDSQQFAAAGLDAAICVWVGASIALATTSEPALSAAGDGGYHSGYQ
jgi:uncharacterized membrane-anchored protein